MRHKKATSIEQVQAGGFAIAPILAGISAVKALQPFTKAKNWLNSADMFNGKRDSKPYKVFKAIADTGSAAGFGKQKRRRKRSK